MNRLSPVSSSDSSIASYGGNSPLVISRSQLPVTQSPLSSITSEPLVQEVVQHSSLHRTYQEALAVQSFDPVMARTLLREVIEKSKDSQLSVSARYYLARMLPESDPEVPLLYREVIASVFAPSIQQVSARYFLAQLCLKGVGGNQSEGHARVLFEQVWVNPLSPPEYRMAAGFWLGVFHNEGREGLPVSKEKAVGFFQEVLKSDVACSEHKATACYELAGCYREGAGGLAASHEEAAALYSRVLTYGLEGELVAKTLFWLGRFHQKGWGGLEQSNQKARELFEKVHSHIKDPEIRACNQYFLGAFLISGEGGVRNYNRGASLLFDLFDEDILPPALKISVRYWLAEALELAAEYETLEGPGWKGLDQTKLYREVINSPEANPTYKTAARCAYALRKDVELEEKKQVLRAVIEDPLASAEQKGKARTVLGLCSPEEEAKFLFLQVGADPQARWTDQLVAQAWLGRHFRDTNPPDYVRAREFFQKVVGEKRAEKQRRLKFLYGEICRELAALYKGGKGGAKDKTKAEELLQIAERCDYDLREDSCLIL